MMPHDEKVSFFRNQAANCQRLAQVAMNPVLRERYMDEAVAWARIAKREVERPARSPLFAKTQPTIQ
jgi:hypothetical protein